VLGDESDVGIVVRVARQHIRFDIDGALLPFALIEIAPGDLAVDIDLLLKIFFTERIESLVDDGLDLQIEIGQKSPRGLRAKTAESVAFPHEGVEIRSGYFSDTHGDFPNFFVG